MDVLQNQPLANELLLRAKRNESNALTAEECMYLYRHLPSNEVPSACKSVLNNSSKTGLISRRASRIGQAWDMAEGHGRRTMYYEDVKGGSIDNANDNAFGVEEEYLAKRSPEAQAKIRQLRTKMSARGAINIRGVDPDEVEDQRQKELQRRLSRREDQRSKR